MGRRIELPKLPAGQTQEQLQALYSYLYQMAEALNNNLAEIGNGGFTDKEMTVVREITGQTETADGMAEAETLKSLIIKTAQLIKSEIDAYNLKLIGTYEAEGKLGRYVRKTRLDVDVTPTGITQKYTFQDIIQGLKTYEVNAKNYIKTGLLRTVSSVPVYGVAIGKDVVTFSNDGTETYNDGNKVAELTADELSFWQNGNKVASYTGTAIVLYSGNSKRLEIDANGVKIYNGSTVLAEFTPTALKFYHNGELREQTDANGVTLYKGSTKLAELLNSALKFYYNGTLRTQMDTDGVKIYNGSTLLMKITDSRISFYYNGNEVFYILSGKIYAAGDMEIAAGKTLKIVSGGVLDVDTNNFKLDSANRKLVSGNWEVNEKGMVYAGTGNKFLISDDNNITDSNVKGGLFYNSTNNGGNIELYIRKADNSAYAKTVFESTQTSQTILYSKGTTYALLGKRDYPYVTSFMQNIVGRSSAHNGQDSTDLWFVLDRNVDENDLLPYGKRYFYVYALQDDTGKNTRFYSSGDFYFEKPIHLDDLYYTNLYQSSSREKKHDIRDMESRGDVLDRLRPVTFVYDEDSEEKTRAGLIYEETEPVLPEICTGDEGNKAINYMELVPILLKEIQELRARVKALEEGGNENG